MSTNTLPPTEGSLILAPQPGPQTMFFETAADIAIYGGAAGGGKTWSIEVEPTRHIHHPGFGAVIFRRLTTHIEAVGGLWESSREIYPHLGARGTKSPYHVWRFPNGNVIQIRHLQAEDDVLAYQGSEIPLIIFDELTHFTPKQFWYMVSRNRSKCGVRPYIRATCNPDPDSFVKPLIEWWLDEDGYAIPERSGVIRWFVKIGDDIYWADSEEEAIAKYSKYMPIDNETGKPQPCLPKSFTFIASKLTDNKVLMAADPSYMANLMAQEETVRAQLLEGNWKIRNKKGTYFKREMFEVVERVDVPKIRKWCRGWDFAATDESEEAASGADWTSGVLMGLGVDDNIYVFDVIYEQYDAFRQERLVVATATQDGRFCTVYYPQDPGSAGKKEALRFSKLLTGFPYRYNTMSGSKELRAKAMAATAQHNRIKLVRGNWNETFINAAANFPPSKGSPDIIDAAVLAFDDVSEGITTNYAAIVNSQTDSGTRGNSPTPAAIRQRVVSATQPPPPVPGTLHRGGRHVPQSVPHDTTTPVPAPAHGTGNRNAQLANKFGTAATTRPANISQEEWDKIPTFL